MKPATELLQDCLADTSAEALPAYRAAVKSAADKLCDLFMEGRDVVELVHARAAFVDDLLCRVWQRFFPADDDDIALIAVGGYGRGELHPGSDIDLMLLLAEDSHDHYREAIEGFLTFLWDIGLEVGQSVRSLSECQEEARRDITVATNLMEARLLYGPTSLFASMQDSVGPEQIWPSRAFFEAKWKEQIQRHEKFHDGAYNLEPNIKEGPGGLRDLQMIGWVSKRHFGAKALHELVTHGFLTESEYEILMANQAMLWTVRFALHIHTGRREDRLLFDHQRAIAEMLGYRDENSDDFADRRNRPADGRRLGVELFMRAYYRAIMELQQLNEMLLQLYQEAILYDSDSSEPVPINRRFQARKGFLEVSHADIFSLYPFAMLEIFLLLQQNPELKGVRAQTIRLLREHRYLIDDNFRQDIRNRSLFMEILRQPLGLTHELRRMDRYGILAGYLPAYARITGQMQFDLFHIYTVDQHTLFVIRNLRRFTVAEFRHEFPLCSKLIHKIPKPELLYLAGLFHDIAKGRGGDHSVLGAQEVRQFCKQHELSRYDTELVAWIIENHLLMSSTAQHRDIDDPEVVNQFASKVQDPTRLDYLYLLTVADMRATNPQVWNSWKDALLSQLYTQTQRAFRRGLGNPLDKREQVKEIQMQARRLLLAEDIDRDDLENIWRGLDDDYFLRYSADEIVWHTRHLAQISSNDLKLPLVLGKLEGHRGSSEIFIHAPARSYLFASVTSGLDRLGLNIVEARIIRSHSGYTLDSYQVLDSDGDPIRDNARLDQIIAEIRQRIESGERPVLAPQQRPTRQVKAFLLPTEVNFHSDVTNQRTVLELVTNDRPGLLSRVAVALLEEDLRLQNAKVATFGAQVEDVFFLTDEQHQPLNPEQMERLRQRLTSLLEPNNTGTT